MDEALKQGGAILALVGALVAVVGWMTKVLVPKLMAQFEAAQAAFLDESREARKAFLEALRDERKVCESDRASDRETRVRMAHEVGKLAEAVGRLNRG